MTLPYYKKYPRDFLEGTVGMTLEQKGAYSLVLDLIFFRGGKLPDDARYIAGQLGCSVRKWNTIQSYLVTQGKLTVKDGIISNKRADNLLIISRKYQDNQAENAKKSKKNSEKAQPSQTTVFFKEDTTVSSNSVRESFEDAWKLYTSCKSKVRQTKKKALDQWPKALKKSDPETLLKAIRLEVEQRRKPSGFVPMLPDMHRWLRDEKWADALREAAPRVVADRDDEPTRELWEHWANHLLMVGEWIPTSQKPPGHPDCKMPPDLLNQIPQTLRSAA